MEIWKILIQNILSWPVAVSALVLLFRRELGSLVGRINSVKMPGFDLSAPFQSATLQMEAKEFLPPSILLKDGAKNLSVSVRLGAHRTVANSDEDLEKKREVLSYGDNLPIILESIKLIEDHLAALSFPRASEETTQVLIRHLAVTQLAARCERVYRLIFGSQIAALHVMDSTGAQPESMLRPIFQAAKDQDSKFYGEYSFEDWIGFLIGQGAVCQDPESRIYGISVYGKSFLEYLGFLSLPPKPH